MKYVVVDPIRPDEPYDHPCYVRKSRTEGWCFTPYLCRARRFTTVQRAGKVLKYLYDVGHERLVVQEVEE